MTAIHEFTTPIWIQTPLGLGRALLLIDYGMDHNPILFTHLAKTGQFKSFDSNDCVGCENLTLGIDRPPPPPTQNPDA